MASKRKRMSSDLKQALIKCQNDGLNYEDTAKYLNSKGYMTLRGRPFREVPGNSGLSLYYKRLNLRKSVGRKKVKTKKPVRQEKVQSLYNDLNEYLDKVTDSPALELPDPPITLKTLDDDINSLAFGMRCMFLLWSVTVFGIGIYLVMVGVG